MECHGEVVGLPLPWIEVQRDWQGSSWPGSTTVESDAIGPVSVNDTNSSSPESIDEMPYSRHAMAEVCEHP